MEKNARATTILMYFLICNFTYAQKLVDDQVLAEMHIFPKDGHDFGIGKASDGTDQWVPLFINWLKNSEF